METSSNIRLAAGVCLAFATLAQSHGFGPGGWGPPGSGGYGYPGGGGGDGSGNGFGGSGNGGNGFPGADVVGFDINQASYFRSIHGILCTAAMVVLFPLGSILMRVIPGRWAIWIHAVFQMLAMAVYVAGAGLGIYLVTYIVIPFQGGNLLTNEATKYHPILGLVVLVTLLPQPFFGLVHHSRFKRVQRRQVWSYLHLFNGRISVTVGIINGGLGLNLAAAEASKKRAYIIVAAVMWSLWMLVALWAEMRRLRSKRNSPVPGVVPVAAAAPMPAMTSAKAVPHRRSDSRSGHSAHSGLTGRRSVSPESLPRRSRDGPPRV